MSVLTARFPLFSACGKNDAPQIRAVADTASTFRRRRRPWRPTWKQRPPTISSIVPLRLASHGRQACEKSGQGFPARDVSLELAPARQGIQMTDAERLVAGYHTAVSEAASRIAPEKAWKLEHDVFEGKGAIFSLKKATQTSLRISKRGTLKLALRPS